MAGFAGGMTSAVCLQPLDLIKTRVQQSTDNSIVSVVRNIHSVRELWRGTLPSAIRTSVGSALYLATLNSLRMQLAHRHSKVTHSASSNLPKLPASENLLAGMVSRAFVGFLTMPITVVKVRFESDLYHYKTLTEAVSSMYKEGMRSFFAGFGATCLRDAPYAGLYMAFYEKYKGLLPTLFKMPKDTLSSSQAATVNSLSAVLAAFFATAITAPFDTIKTNMQLNRAKYHTFSQTAYSLGKESWRRLFDGMELRLLRKAGSAGIAWGIYEEIVKM